MLWRATYSTSLGLTLVRVSAGEDDPQHDGEAVDVRLLRGAGVDVVQVLRGHVAQRPGPLGFGPGR